MKPILILALVSLAFLFLSQSPRRVAQLPPGEVVLHSPIVVQGNTELRGAPSGTVLRAAADFKGAGMIQVAGPAVRLRNLTLDGNRESLEVRSGLPGYDKPFAAFTPDNGIFADGVRALAIDHIKLRNIAGFAILVSKSHAITIDHIDVSESGSRNDKGRNNASGGILLEEGTTDFQVTNCNLRNIRGNGIWTHSLYTSPRNAEGLIALNRLTDIGRDAIQVGHARNIRVEENTGLLIGFPEEDVDMEGRAIPVGIDTAGNVDGSSYARNRFEEINGKCIDLDGFHDGQVRENECVNHLPPNMYRFGNYGIVMNNSNPDMQSQNIRVIDNTIDAPLFGGIFVIGTGHRVVHNRLLNLNAAHCNDGAAEFGCYYTPGEPDMLRSGIYLGKGAERPAPAHGNVIEDNEITGYEMKTHCVGYAPGIDPKANTVEGNVCK